MARFNYITADNFTPNDFGVSAFVALGDAFNQSQPNPTIILPTGGSPKPLYQKMREAAFLLPSFQYIGLDQYNDVEFDDPRSYPLEIQREVLSSLKVSIDHSLVFNAKAANPHNECARIEQAIKQAGGIDICLLGIGPNGHIGFNEPGTAFDSRAHLVDLTAETLEANAPYCDPHGGVPKQALTLGLATIFESRRIILLSNKPDITAKALLGPITPDVPASILQNHKNLTVVATRDVAVRLGLAA